MSYSKSIEIYKAYYYLNVMCPVQYLFLLYMTMGKNLQLGDALLLFSLYNLTTVLLEVPFGYLAELIGYKKTMLIGTIFIFFSFILMYKGNGFFHMSCMVILQGISGALLSGADEALCYEYFKKNGQEDKFKKWISKMYGRREVLGGIVTVFGGYLFAVNMNFPVMASIFVAFIMCGSVVLLTEVPVRGKGRTSIIAKTIISSLFRTTYLYKYYLLLATIGNFLLANINFTVTTYMQTMNFNLKYVGVLLLAFKIAAGAGGKLNNKLGMSLEKLFCFCAILVAILGYSKSWMFSVLLLLLLRIVNGMFYPSASAEINRHISGNRAYLLSVQNLAQSASLAVGTPLLGYMIDNRGYSSAYISMLIFVLFIFIALIGWKYKNKH